MTHKILQPAGWPRAKGYSNGIVARGTQVFIAGQIGWDADQKFSHTRLAPQVGAALANVVRVLAEAGGRPEHIVRLTWYVTSRRGVSRAAARNRRGLSRRDGPAFSGDVRGAGLGADRGRCEGRDRGDRRAAGHLIRREESPCPNGDRRSVYATMPSLVAGRPRRRRSARRCSSRFRSARSSCASAPGCRPWCPGARAKTDW